MVHRSGFGFTGGHFHGNWIDDNFRTVVLNAIAWIAQIDVPANGVPSATPTRDELLENQDYPVDPERLKRDPYAEFRRK